MNQMTLLQQILAESPQIVNGNESVVQPDRMAMSQGSIDRDWSYFGEYADVDFYVMIANDNIGVRGLSRTANQHGRRPIMIDLQLVPFKYGTSSMHKQVIRVWASPTARGAGLARFAYESLVDKGIVVVSDKDQLIGGAKLWESFIRSSRHSVALYNVNNKTESLVTPETDLTKVWTMAPDPIGRYSLLFMFKPNR